MTFENFQLISEIAQIETIAAGSSVRERHALTRRYGRGRWRKLKGVATVRLDDGAIYTAEVHWYEAHGIGKRKMKIKRILY
jgi:hypothetical protein